MRLSVQNLGPIAEADVTFGDLTILVGPQATGKSIFLQTLKLVRDHRLITQFLESKGYFWGNPPNEREFLELYFGEGAAEVWSEKTAIALDGTTFKLAPYIQPEAWHAGEFPIPMLAPYVPAQRAIAVQSGWPKSFTDYGLSDPYTLREFSEVVRFEIEQQVRDDPQVYLDRVLGAPDEYWHLRHQVSGRVSRSIYQEADLQTDYRNKRRQIVLKIDQITLPYAAWSTGQREFLPLLLFMGSQLDRGFSSTVESRKNTTVIVEEPEMGLHPKAIQAFLLLVLELIYHGYKVILSTHSPVVLEMAWALSRLKQAGAGPAQVARLFDVPMSTDLEPLFAKGVTADVKVYYFDRGADARVRAKDISALDPAAADPGEAEWGGLSAFATRATDVVTEIMAEYWSTHPQPTDE